MTNDKNNGMALITVLFLVVIMIIMMTSLLTLTTQTLFKATSDVKKGALLAIADSALTECLILLSDDMDWGTNNEKLLMRSTGQNFEAAGFNPNYLPEVNSEFDFSGVNGYYISFDPNDAVFGDNKYYSVNNLKGSAAVPSWRPGVTVPPYTADIVTTVVEDNTVKYVEVLVVAVPDKSFIVNGAQGSCQLIADNLTLNNLSNSPTNFHTNNLVLPGYSPTPYFGVFLKTLLNSMDYLFTGGTFEPEINIADDVILSTSGEVKINDFLEPNNIQNLNCNAPTKNPLYIDIPSIVADIPFEPDPWPSGTYIFREETGELCWNATFVGSEEGHYNDSNSIFFTDGEEIVPGVTFTASPPCITISNNMNLTPSGRVLVFIEFEVFPTIGAHQSRWFITNPQENCCLIYFCFIITRMATIIVVFHFSHYS